MNKFTFTSVVEQSRRASTAFINAIPQEDVQHYCSKAADVQFQVATIVAEYWDNQLALVGSKLKMTA